MNIRAKLTDSVSIDEMRTMRECGLGNAEIAKRLDVTPATIYRYIGKQPKELHKPCGRAGQRAKQEAEAYERQKREDEEARRKAHELWEDKMEAARKEWEEQNRIANDQIAPDEKVEDDGLVVTAEDAKVEYTSCFTTPTVSEEVIALRIISSVIHAESEDYRYRIDGENKTIRIEMKNPVSIRTYTADTLRAYINELNEALSLL